MEALFDFVRDQVIVLDDERQRLADEVRRRDAVLDWLRENNPTALALCPYKLHATETDAERRARETAVHPDHARRPA